MPHVHRVEGSFPNNQMTIIWGEATQDVHMITDAQEGNSPTPKADIPLAPPNLDANKPILDMLTMIQKQLE